MTISSLLKRFATSNNGGIHDHVVVHRNVWYYENSTPTSAILLIAFNMASAGLLMATVIFDLWKASKKNGSLSSEYVRVSDDD
jgi:hypothetical protein